jgi:hypothetical protein
MVWATFWAICYILGNFFTKASGHPDLHPDLWFSASSISSLAHLTYGGLALGQNVLKSKCPKLIGHLGGLDMGVSDILVSYILVSNFMVLDILVIGHFGFQTILFSDILIFGHFTLEPGDYGRRNNNPFLFISSLRRAIDAAKIASKLHFSCRCSSTFSYSPSHSAISRNSRHSTE